MCIHTWENNEGWNILVSIFGYFGVKNCIFSHFMKIRTVYFRKKLFMQIIWQKWYNLNKKFRKFSNWKIVILYLIPSESSICSMASNFFKISCISCVSCSLCLFQIDQNVRLKIAHKKYFRCFFLWCRNFRKKIIFSKFLRVNRKLQKNPHFTDKVRKKFSVV